MKKVILYIAMSLDGFIAGEHDDLSFLDGYEHVKLVQTSYEKLMSSIDTIVMGRRTYDWIMKMSSWPYDGYDTFVITSKPEESSCATLVSDNPEDLIKRLKEQPGKDIWLVGGGMLASDLIKKNLVDQLELAWIPTLLGQGIPLFQDVKAHFKLADVKNDGGLILATYQK